MFFFFKEKSFFFGGDLANYYTNFTLFSSIVQVLPRNEGGWQQDWTYSEENKEICASSSKSSDIDPEARPVSYPRNGMICECQDPAILLVQNKKHKGVLKNG